jgi:hypothetical protein
VGGCEDNKDKIKTKFEELLKQVTLVQGLAQLFLVEIALLINYQAIDLYN